MDPDLRQQRAEAQYEQLCAHDGWIRQHGTRINNTTLASLGVVRSTPLDVDEPTPCDFENRFFIPSYDEDTYAVLNEGHKLRTVWGETMDRNKDDPEWIQSAIESYPHYRSFWFKHCFENLQQTVLDDCFRDEDEAVAQPARTDGWRNALFLDPDEEDLIFPQWEQREADYRTMRIFQPRNDEKPHLAILMGDTEVGREDEMLTSELEAAIEMSKRQISCGLFSDHHTKPILVYTLMWETHGRITQAHFDTNINKLVIRQSRVLNLQGKDDEPPPDAYLLLRWMMNTPVGDTKYRYDAETKLDGQRRDIPAEKNLITSHAS